MDSLVDKSLVERLREYNPYRYEHGQFIPTLGNPCTEAADTIAALCEALAQNVTALDDWLHTYANDLCNEHDVQDSWQRITTNGGTLSYIAELQQLNRAALAKATT